MASLTDSMDALTTAAPPFLCGITREPPEKPVELEGCGHVFDQDALARWRRRDGGDDDEAALAVSVRCRAVAKWTAAAARAVRAVAAPASAVTADDVDALAARVPGALARVAAQAGAVPDGRDRDRLWKWSARAPGWPRRRRDAAAWADALVAEDAVGVAQPCRGSRGKLRWRIRRAGFPRAMPCPRCVAKTFPPKPSGLSSWPKTCPS